MYFCGKEVPMGKILF